MNPRKSIGVAATVVPFWFIVVYLVLAGLHADYSFLTTAIKRTRLCQRAHGWFWNVLGCIVPGLAITLLWIPLKSEFSDTGRFAWIPASALAASGIFMVMSGVFPGNFVNRTAPQRP